MSGIRVATREYADEEVSALLQPEVRDWWDATFGAVTPPQRFTVPEVHAGEHVLISSPTGTGKTLAAFLAVLNELVALGKRGELDDHVYCVYVSPLKALNNDMERNLVGPLEGIKAVFEAAGATAPDVRVAVRTGDTPTSERAKQTKRPPHIIITTPESLAIMLSAPKMGEHVAKARWVIVDEVHALAESKRGVQLVLSLERLAARARLAGRPEPVRVGLSATIAPIEEVARFLVGTRADPADAAKRVPRDCLVVDVNYLNFTDLKVVSPVADLVNTPPQQVQEALYDLLDDLISKHRTTLIFTNTRAGTERMVHRLKQRFGDRYAELGDPEEESQDPEFVAPQPDDPDEAARGFVAAHHGSLSKERRLEVEDRLRAGDLKCVVCSTSLELGLDIGYVDLVVLLGSPKGIARALQRVGRSGHHIGATSKGRLVVLDRDDLVECAVLVKQAQARELDRIRFPRLSLDVLCQTLVGMALERPWGVDEAFELARAATPFADLDRATFMRCLHYLAGLYKGLEERRVYGKVWLDEDAGMFGKRGRMVRAIYSMNAGTIPDTTLAKVFAGERYVGQVEEDFVEGLVPGDVFLLGGDSWQFNYTRGMKVHVSAGRGRRATVPRWSSEQLPLARDLAAAVRAFRDVMAKRLATEPREATHAWLQAAYALDATTASALLEYFDEQARFAAVPGDAEVLVEEFVGDDLARNYVFHAVLGRRANEVLARTFARSLTATRSVNVRIQVTDHGFVLSVPRRVVLPARDVRGLFHADIDTELYAALENSELLKRRFRHVAARAFLILRNYAGRTNTVGRQQVNAFVLLHVLRRLDRQFPVVEETYRELFEEALDVRTASEFAFDVMTRKRTVRYLRQRKAPSPFAFNLVIAAAEDAVLIEDRARLLKDLHERVQDLLAEGDA